MTDEAELLAAIAADDERAVDIVLWRRRAADFTAGGGDVRARLDAALGATRAAGAWAKALALFDERAVPEDDRAVRLRAFGPFKWIEAWHDLMLVPTGPTRIPLFEDGDAWSAVSPAIALRKVVVAANATTEEWLPLIETYCALFHARPLLTRAAIERLKALPAETPLAPEVARAWRPLSLGAHEVSLTVEQTWQLVAITIDVDLGTVATEVLGLSASVAEE